MDFKFTPQQERLRKEVVDYLRVETPPEFDAGYEEGLDTDEFFYLAKAFGQKLSKKGWLVPGWPKEYGGAGFSLLEHAIVKEQIGYFGIPPYNNAGLAQGGPAIIKHGTEEQKQRFIPPLARGETTWTQGFSEPNAGSDLAAVSTLATRRGDHYVINGQKTFASRAHWSEYCYMLVRTDPNAPRKHDGLSMFLVDLKSPGIEVRPLHTITNSFRTNEVFFDNVVVPASNLIGEEGAGWRIATTTLDYERSRLEECARFKRTLDDFLWFCQHVRRFGKSPFESEVTRARIAQCAIEHEAWKLLCWRVAWMQNEGLVPNHEASIQNAYGKDFRQRFGQVVAQVVGQYTLLEQDSPLAPMEARFQRLYMFSTNKHGQGTSEIQRNIIALRGLGLPRERR